MLTFGPRQGSSFHARVDVPHDTSSTGTAFDEVVSTLLRPACQHGVRQAVFLLYDHDETRAEHLAWSLRDDFTDAGIELLDVLRVTPAQWFAILPGHRPEHYRGVAYELASHPFTVQGVLAGRVVHRSRDDLRAMLEPDHGAVQRTTVALADPDCTVLEPGGVVELVAERLADRSPFSTVQLARVARSIQTGSARDEAWGWLGRDDAVASIDLWTDAVRRLPTTEVGSAAAVLAFVTWLAGDGALSWCAVDRAREADPGNSLARLVADLLDSATSPEAWAAVRDQMGSTGDPAA